MIETLRSWLTSIVVVTLLLSVARTLAPEGSLRQITSFLGGLILLAALLGPVLTADLAGWDMSFSAWQEAVEARQEELQENQESQLAAIIGAETEAYISDKAVELGVSVTARVETRTGEDGVPVPWSAVLTGQRSAELEACLAEDLGIPAERQVWHERIAEN